MIWSVSRCLLLTTGVDSPQLQTWTYFPRSSWWDVAFIERRCNMLTIWQQRCRAPITSQHNAVIGRRSGDDIPYQKLCSEAQPPNTRGSLHLTTTAAVLSATPATRGKGIDLSGRRGDATPISRPCLRKGVKLIMLTGVHAHFKIPRFGLDFGRLSLCQQLVCS